MNKKDYTYGLILLSFLIFSLAMSSQAQDIANSDYILNSDTTFIRWVDQYPSKEIKKEKKGIFNKIGKFFFGKTSVVLIKPVSVLGVTPDNFWVLDQGSGKILQIQKQEGNVPKFIDRNFSNLRSLVGICSMPDRRILFTESGINKIFKIAPDKKEIKILNDSLLLEQPTGIAYSEVTNEIWVVETHAHRISILDEKGNLIRRIGKRGNSPGEFNFPTFIWIDDSGTVYIVDSMNFRIQIFDKNGEFESMFGETGDATGYFARPKGIATDSYGNIYIIDVLFHVVQVFDSSGKLLYYFGGQGREKGQFWLPSGIYIDDSDYIYIADSYNSRIQVFQLVMKD